MIFRLPERIEDVSLPKTPTWFLDSGQGENRKRERVRKLFALTGHLYERKLIGLKLVQSVICNQLTRCEVPEETYVESICQLVLSIGIA